MLKDAKNAIALPGEDPDSPERDDVFLYCPYCKSVLQSGKRVRCSICGTLHHLRCWTQAEGCSRTGCAGKAAAVWLSSQQLAILLVILLGIIFAAVGSGVRYLSGQKVKEARTGLLPFGPKEPIRATTQLQDLSRHVYNGNPAMVRKMLNSGNVNEQNFDGSTPLLLAALSGETEILRVLLQHGANPNLAGEDGVTPLGIAVIRRNEEMVTHLLGFQADVNAREYASGKRGTTALMYAAQNGSVKILKMLIAAGAGPNVSAADGMTALMYAAQGYHQEIVEFLLAKGANPNSKDDRNRTALSFIHPQTGLAMTLRDAAAKTAN